MHELVICPPDLPCRVNLWNIPPWAQLGLYVTMTVATLIMLIGVFRRVRLWRQGQPYPALNELPERVRRLFTYGFRQDRINRQPYSGLMHASIFWGFVTLFIGTALATVDADIALPLMNFKVLQGWFYEVYKLALDIAGLFFVLALGFALFRRYGRRFPRLGSERSFAFTLLLLLLINLTGLLIESLRLAVVQPPWSDWSIVGNAIAQVWLALGATEAQLRATHLVSWLTHFSLVAVFIAAIPVTNLFHLVTSPTNIFFSDPVRPMGALRPIPVEDVEKFGAETTEDFTWKQRLGFDACTYCGRCQSVCPAMASGTILSPKNVVVKLGFAMGVPTLNNADLMAAMPAGGHSNGHQNGKVVNLHGDIFQADEMWACTTCAACIWECPVYIEIVDDIVDMRRYLTMSEGNLPSGAASALTMIERTGNPWGYPLAERHDWAKGLGVPFLEPGQPVDYVFWVGCSMAYDARNQKIARSIVKILKQAGVSVALLAEEQCNGDPARRLGNEYLYQAQARTNIDNLKQYQFKTIMTGCPHCFNTILNEYPQFGGDFQVVHHSQVIADLIKAGKIPLDSGLAEQITFHDSCYLGRYNNIFDAPREALAATGANLLEMPRNREKGFCCGGGGGQIWMEVPAAQRINHLRMDEALTLNPSMVATACPFCMTMMDDAAKVKGVEETVAVKDFAEIIAERMQ
ncbi:MAG: (Fe-S)-binding protein [Anaerolineae bacterium]|nr:(Fe-S)-binding protein [Anaerolineae bacterium]